MVNHSNAWQIDAECFFSANDFDFRKSELTDT